MGAPIEKNGRWEIWIFILGDGRFGLKKMGAPSEKNLGDGRFGEKNVGEREIKTPHQGPRQQPHNQAGDHWRTRHDKLKMTINSICTWARLPTCGGCSLMISQTRPCLKSKEVEILYQTLCK